MPFAQQRWCDKANRSSIKAINQRYRKAHSKNARKCASKCFIVESCMDLSHASLTQKLTKNFYGRRYSIPIQCFSKVSSAIQFGHKFSLPPRAKCFQIRAGRGTIVRYRIIRYRIIRVNANIVVSGCAAGLVDGGPIRLRRTALRSRAAGNEGVPSRRRGCQKPPNHPAT
jgi:hypothetical protein